MAGWKGKSRGILNINSVQNEMPKVGEIPYQNQKGIVSNFNKLWKDGLANFAPFISTCDTDLNHLPTQRNTGASQSLVVRSAIPNAEQYITDEEVVLKSLHGYSTHPLVSVRE